MKTGWWVAKWDITLEGIGIDFDELSEASQEHILKAIAEGFHQGEVVEEEVEDNAG